MGLCDYDSAEPGYGEGEEVGSGEGGRDMKEGSVRVRVRDYMIRWDGMGELSICPWSLEYHRKKIVRSK